MSMVHNSANLSRFPVALPDRYALFGSAVAAYVALFAGRFSVGRIFASEISHGSAWGEVRFWALAFAVLLAIVGVRANKVAVHPDAMARAWRAVAWIALAHFLLIMHVFLFSPADGSTYMIWELATIALVAVVMVLGFRAWGLRYIYALAWIALAFALVLTIWMLAASFLVQQVDGARPLATTFSFYRIQLFGGFAGLYVLFEQRHLKYRLPVALAAAVCFASADLSLSKAALLAGSAGLLLLAAVYLVWFQKMRALVVVGVASLAILLFTLNSGHMFMARVSEGLLGVGYSMSTDSVAPPKYVADPTTAGSVAAAGTASGERAVATEESAATLRLKFDAQRRLAAIVACSAGQSTCSFEIRPWEQDIADAMLRFHTIVPDYSFRIRLLTYGMRGFAEAPWLGNGFGNFHAVATNLYTKEPEPYAHPHNIVVELLFSAGLIGTLVVLAILLVMLWEVLRNRERIGSGLPFLSFVVAVLIGAVFGGDYIDFRLVWHGLLICVMIAAAQQQSAGRVVQ